MSKNKAIAAAIAFLLVVATFGQVALCETPKNNVICSVAGVTSYRDQWEAYQQRAFFGQGRYWVFYYNGSNGSHDHEVFVSSTDGLSWSAPKHVTASSIDTSHSFSIWYDGVYVYNFASIAWATAVSFQKGLVHTDGTIAWQPEQIVVGSPGNMASKDNYWYPQGCVDSNGYPWVAYQRSNDTMPATFIAKSSTNDGTWNTASGFPYLFSHLTPLSGIGQGVYPLTNGKVVAISVTSGHAFLQAWTGTNWLPQIESPAKPGGDQYGYFVWSAVSQGDKVHFVYDTTTVDWGVGYELYNYDTNSFGAESIVETSGAINWGYTATPLTLDETTGALYVFWTNPHAGDGHYNEIRYKKCFNSAWDTESTLLFNQTASDIPSPLTLSSFYYAYDGHLGVIYNTGNQFAPPYQIHFINFVDNSPPPTATSSSSASEPTTSSQAMDVYFSPLYILAVVTLILSVVAILYIRLKGPDAKIHAVPSAG